MINHDQSEWQTKQAYRNEDIALQEAVPGVLWIICVSSVEEYRPLVTGDEQFA